MLQPTPSVAGLLRGNKRKLSCEFVTNRVQIVAHRGVAYTHRENTIAAFTAAVDARADGVELDARRTSDGYVVVHHNPHLDDGRAIVDVARRDLPDYLSTLSAALDACGSLLVNVEIKNLPHQPDFDAANGIVAPVVDAIRAWGGAAYVSSFNPTTLAAVRHAAPKIDTALIVAGSLDVDAVAAGVVAVHVKDAFMNGAMVAALHERELAAGVWTVNEADRMRVLADAGVDVILTDDVELAQIILR